MEAPLLDLGFNIPASSGTQQPQQQQLNFDPFGIQPTAQQPQQQQQPKQENLDPFGMPQTAAQPSPQQAQQSSFDDAFGASKPNTQQPVSSTQQPSFDDAFGVSQQPAKQHTNSAAQPKQFDFDAPFTDAPKAAAANPQQPLQPRELNFDVLVDSASQPVQNTPAQQAVQAAQTAPDAKANGSAANASSAGGAVEQASQPTSVDASVAKDGAPLDNKAKLKEIWEVFGGRWRLLRSDPFAEYLKAVGVGLLTRNRASSGSQDLQISIVDGYIYINTSSLLHSQIIKLKLDEAFENVVLKTNQSVFCTYQNKKLELQMTPLDVAWSKTQAVEYTINDTGELMVAYAAGSNTCRRCYAKVNEV